MFGTLGLLLTVCPGWPDVQVAVVVYLGNGGGRVMV